MNQQLTCIRSRLLSLDVFRGFTIALMILVNSPGNRSTYSWLEHSAWNGCTLADVVFPFFLFIVGVSLVFSLNKARSKGVSSAQLSKKILRRTFIIFFIGLCLNLFPYHGLEHLRVYGVLQRIAVCYAAAAFVFLYSSVVSQLLICSALLLCYWMVIPLSSGHGHFSLVSLTPEHNLGAYVDRLLFSGSHLYGKTYDPEGLLSTLPAVASTMIGNFVGIWLSSATKAFFKFYGLVIAGLICAAAGWVWGLSFPINKILWTSSYVLWTSGLAMLILAFCYGLIDIRNIENWCKPFEIFGLNALAVYILHVLFLKIQFMIPMPSGNLKSYFTQLLFGWASSTNASLFYALSYTLLWYFILWIFYRKNIFIKI
ncbi:acyltransferase family protein [Legionella jordanis]|uniref:Putative Heparan-alpha-glucosaminide N-acetyltransferase n=1 Tax=Legionella jordanis TaxID=456 RepID=A0A0W0VAB4_9GAMM|nr:DUF5009 domain-containing protein [Legionella jordanis]KTD17068.1 putative Heparan-alpha-glucosaminide N-acetyltransferase [Legionella jordanis]RMX03201.1 DUF5009 domain-containing protein [Legionella jordanis]RMX18659.1 DUF5009 domain-containing protein [Legionella jordanis]VEH12735.1 Putative heparan-alpha-glucosaminide N-acetyltransferase [Legionella jordanis]